MASPVELVELDLEELGEHFGRLRVHTPDSERGMARSMRLYGQLSPVVVCLREGASAIKCWWLLRNPLVY